MNTAKGNPFQTAKDMMDCLFSVQGKYASVWTYGPVQGWQWYLPDAPEAGNLHSMKPGKGYWIEVTVDCAWECQ